MQLVAPASAATVTAAQLSAVHTVMRLFVDEDLAKGVSPSHERYCHGCQGGRSAPGFVRYGELELCHPCATDYELGRLSGLTQSAEEYVGDQHAHAA
jgi:hypothetical protein